MREERPATRQGFFSAISTLESAILSAIAGTVAPPVDRLPLTRDILARFALRFA
jgi:hypothetical protein